MIINFSLIQSHCQPCYLKILAYQTKATKPNHFQSKTNKWFSLFDNILILNFWLFNPLSLTLSLSIHKPILKNKQVTCQAALNSYNFFPGIGTSPVPMLFLNPCIPANIFYRFQFLFSTGQAT